MCDIVTRTFTQEGVQANARVEQSTAQGLAARNGAGHLVTMTYITRDVT